MYLEIRDNINREQILCHEKSFRYINTVKCQYSGGCGGHGQGNMGKDMGKHSKMNILHLQFMKFTV